MPRSTTISDLPLSLRTLIIHQLYPLPAHPPLSLHLAHLSSHPPPLPLQLLPVAQSLPSLAAAVADALGPRAEFLSPHSTPPSFSLWLRALSPHVIAVSLSTPLLASFPDCSNARRLATGRASEITTDVGIWLASLAEPLLALRVLDLASVPVECLEVDERLMQPAMIAALTQNERSLRELALPVHRVCARALRETPLGQLEVAAIEVQSGQRDMVLVEEMLLAVEKSRGDGGVREVCLRGLIGVPFENAGEEGLGERFRRGVVTVRVISVVGRALEKYGRMDRFLEGFGNVCCVEWGWFVTEESLMRLVKKNPKLQEVHLLPPMEVSEEVGEAGCVKGDARELPRVFKATGQKLRILQLRGGISEQLLRVLGDSCRELRVLKLDISPDNVSGLVPLLRDCCRNLQALNLTYRIGSEHTTKVLGTTGWDILAHAVCQASKELCEVTLGNGWEADAVEHDVEAMVIAISRILTSLGLSADTVQFWARTDMLEHRRINAISRVVEAASRSCKNLKNLEVCMWGSAERLAFVFLPTCGTPRILRKMALEELRVASNKLRKTARGLYHLNTVGINPSKV